MLPSTPEYFWFLMVLFFAYWLLSRLRFAGLALILLANYFFFAKWGLIYLAIIPAAGTIDYLIGHSLERSSSKGVRRSLVVASILMNVGLIAAGKYLPFFTQVFRVTDKDAHSLDWTLPLGFSFYAFQALTYTIDIYRRDIKPAGNYFEYLAAVSFFPTTLAGPITRVAVLVGQWRKPNRVLGGDDGGRALFLIALGLSKKFLIADYLANNLINRVFDLPTLYSGGEVLVAAYAYAFQLYYDFSGYTDIAIGSALLFGFKLPANFNRPYQAENIVAFWKRWHITLSNWLTEYLYFSLPGKRTKVMPFVNVIITFAIGGLWHGANWTFLVWGFLHGFGLATVRLGQALRGGRKPSTRFALRVLRAFVTFNFVTFAWIFFRSASLTSAWQMLDQIGSFHFTFDNVTGPFVMVLAIAVLLHYTPKDWYRQMEQSFSASPALVQAALIVSLVLAIQYLGATGAAPFIYTKF